MMKKVETTVSFPLEIWLTIVANTQNPLALLIVLSTLNKTFYDWLSLEIKRQQLLAVGIKQVAAGSSHTLCLGTAGNVFSFGEDGNGKLGLGKNLKTSWFVDELPKEVDTRQPNLISGLKNIVQISAGYTHILCLDADGQVFAFGSNTNGQLGIDFTEKEWRELRCRELFLDDMGKDHPVLIPELKDIQQISAGGEHSLCLDKSGNVFAFGQNNEGQLGCLIDGKDASYKPVKIQTLKNIQQVVASYNSSYCLDADGNVFAFGSNRNGQLGTGNTENQHLPVLIPDLKNIVQIYGGGNAHPCPQ